MKKVLLFGLILLLLAGLIGCGSTDTVISTTTSRATFYRVEADGSETMCYYSDTTITVMSGGKGLQEIKTYAPDGTLLMTKSGEDDFVHTKDYAAYEAQLNEKTAFSLIGTQDVDYTCTKDDSGITTEEVFKDKTGNLPTAKIKYTTL